ncbi:ATP-dependent RNA helicase dbp10 [Coemansia sp. BCRC 34962]|nr:ATP-dependent RNA helicase dbp10 [Coemansia sp. BCRC 34962]
MPGNTRDMEGDSDSDVEFDLTSSLIPQSGDTEVKQTRRAAASTKVRSDLDMAVDGESSDESETDMIQRSVQAQNRKSKKSGGFQSMGLHPPLFRAIMNKGFKVPTPIQRKTIPVIMQGRDVVGMARTGSGKTAAFLIPMINRLKAHSAKVGSRAIVLSPSRELALQTHQVTKDLVKYTDLRAVPIVGGDSMEDQFGIMASNPDIIIATPGRLLHLVVEMSLDLSTIEYIVFDEADRLFELGFSVQLHEILGRLAANRQTLLFSATLPSTLVDFAKAGLQDPELIRLDVESKISQDLEMAFFNVKHDEKDGALIYLLRDIVGAPVNSDKTIKSQAWRRFGSRPSGSSKAKKDDAAPRCQTIVFVSTKHHVEYLNGLLTEFGFAVSHIYGSLDQSARKIQIARFTAGKTQVLVVTDVAARGIDIPILENVINYDFVDSSKVFVHRVGRVARAGRRGWAYSLVTAEELPHVLDLQLFLGRPLHLGTSVYAKNSRQPSYNKEIILGQFPLELTMMDKEWVDQAIAGNINIEGQQKTALNGAKLYRKSKQSAASESYKRAKEIQLAESFAEPHILLSSRIDPDERQRMEMLRNLSGFRPNETIFEIGSRGVKHTTTASLVMQNYRMSSDRYISHTKKVRNNKEDPMDRFGSDHEGDDTSGGHLEKLLNPNNSSVYRDDDFYIPYSKTDLNTEKGYAMSAGGSFIEKAQGAVMAINGDENETMLAMQHAKQSKNTLRWDSKKKNFVRGIGIGSDNKKLIKTESGTMLPASFKSGTYRDWQDRTKVSIPRAGEQELLNASGKAAAGKYATGRFQHTKLTEAKPLDPLALDYEHKLKKRKQEAATNDGGDADGKYKGTVEFKDEGGGRNSGHRGGKKGDTWKKQKTDKASPKSELKSRDQISKARMEKEKRTEKTGRHDKKGGGGRGGSRGGGRGGSRGGSRSGGSSRGRGGSRGGSSSRGRGGKRR